MAKQPEQTSILPQNVQFTPEEDAFLDEMWARIADEEETKAQTHAAKAAETPPPQRRRRRARKAAED